MILRISDAFPLNILCGITIMMTCKDAKALAELIKDSHARVNLIRFHAIPGSNLQTSDEQSMIEFRDYLNSQGILCTIRKSQAERIFLQRCGMLAGKDLK